KLGALPLLTKGEVFLFSPVVGIGSTHLVLTAGGISGLLYPWTIWLTAALLLGISLIEARVFDRRIRISRLIVTKVLTIPKSGLFLLALAVVWTLPFLCYALLPNVDWDGDAYHIPVAKEFLSHSLLQWDPLHYKFDRPALARL